MVNHQQWTSVGLLILRLGFGGYMLTHGWGKLQLVLGGKWNSIGDPIGIGEAPSLILLTFAEFLCSLLIIIGLGTRLAAIPLVIAMAVAAFVAHGKDPWTMEQAAKLFFAQKMEFPASKQFPLMYLIPFLALIFTGPGRFSIDALIARRPRSGASKASRS